MDLDDMDDDEDSGSETFSVEFESLQTSNRRLRPSSNEFEVMSCDNLMQSMNAIIDDVKSILPLSATIVRILLGHAHWDKERLIESYFERTQEVLFREAHIVNPYTPEAEESTAGTSKTAFECKICFTISENPLTGLRCGHTFCSDCWTTYLTMQIMSEGLSTAIQCPETRCDILVDDEKVCFYIHDEKVKAKYRCLITNSYVVSNKLLKWCPSPTSCSYVVRVKSTDSTESLSVQCKCGYRFCFNCNDSAHDPALCEQLRNWRRRSAEDAKSLNWIETNAKECPQCHSAIEKNGGCNNMTCVRCKYHFCWLCLKVVPHTVPCNAVERVNQSSLTFWTRFMHYHQRFQQHQHSLGFENALKQRFRGIVQDNLELRFLDQAVNILCDSRYTLMCSFVFAFYVHMCNDLLIFEDNQANFERGVEDLADILERDHSPAQFLLMKPQIIDKFKFCEDRRVDLLNHVEEDPSVWRFIEY